MAQFCTLTPLSTLVKCDFDKTINLSYTALQTGFEFHVIDDLQRASEARPITILATLPAGVNSAIISNPGGSVRLTWAGAFYVLG
jgi:hypothetical protein